MKSHSTIIALGSLYQFADITPRILSKRRSSSTSPYHPDRGLSQVQATVSELVDPNLYCLRRGRVEIYRMTFVCWSIACVALYPVLSTERQQNMLIVNDNFFGHKRNGMLGQIVYG
ncbi:hypothetical protein Y032_0421g1175 [Ancylostoma ceylanicum]|uniref:Uncharacterized protein n=1 Tax=Ancylostoma ceylanicum TaxID=53326 RepID=A0A016X158_9BILA|nr:hypothetical protein Y032_0421g1175 [Ancylostoma ceylanicum]